MIEEASIVKLEFECLTFAHTVYSGDPKPTSVRIARSAAPFTLVFHGSQASNVDLASPVRTIPRAVIGRLIELQPLHIQRSI